MEKRAVFKQIVSDFSKAVESGNYNNYMHKDTVTITDDDIVNFQKSQLNSTKKGNQVRRNQMRENGVSEPRKGNVMNYDNKRMANMAKSCYEKGNYSTEINESNSNFNMRSNLNAHFGPSFDHNSSLINFNRNPAFTSKINVNNSLDQASIREGNRKLFSREQKINANYDWTDMKRKSFGTSSIIKFQDEDNYRISILQSSEQKVSNL